MKQIFTLITLFIAVSVTAQLDKSSKLYKTILKLDTEFFDAYNNCETQLEKYASFYDEDLEFFHDQGGLSTSKDDTVEATRKNICGKVTRELVPDSFEMYEIKGYGVIAIGHHKFNNLVEKSISKPSKFIVFWKRTDNNYKIAKVVSLH